MMMMMVGEINNIVFFYIFRSLQVRKNFWLRDPHTLTQKEDKLILCSLSLIVLSSTTLFSWPLFISYFNLIELSSFLLFLFLFSFNKYLYFSFSLLSVLISSGFILNSLNFTTFIIISIIVIIIIMIGFWYELECFTSSHPSPNAERGSLKQKTLIEYRIFWRKFKAKLFFTVQNWIFYDRLFIIIILVSLRVLFCVRKSSWYSPTRLLV